MLHPQSTSFIKRKRGRISSPFESAIWKCSAVILMQPCANGTTPQKTRRSHMVARCNENVLFSRIKWASIFKWNLRWPGRALQPANTATLLGFQKRMRFGWSCRSCVEMNLNNHLSARRRSGSLAGRRLPAMNIFNYFCRWDTCLGSCKVHACTSRQSLASRSRTVPNELCE